MYKQSFIVAALGLGLGCLNPAHAAPTDPTKSGTMDVSKDANDTSTDSSVNPPPQAKKTLEDKNKTAKDGKVTKRHSPKVQPVNPNSPKVNVPNNDASAINPTPSAAQNAPGLPSATPGTATPPQAPAGY